MRRFLKYLSPVIFILCAAGVEFALSAEDALRQELDEIKQNQQVIQKDLMEIKALLSRLTAQIPPPQPTPQQQPETNIKGTAFDIGGNPVIGSESAKLILVEFSDYQCPFCGRYARETFPQIKERYIDKGLIRYTVIDQPLAMHPEAAKAAEASHCAEEQGKFWEMHEKMMADQDALKNLSSYAKALKLNVRQFEDCLNTGKYGPAVNRDMALANELGISGVPGFIIGTVDEKDPRAVTGISEIRGAAPFGNFQHELDAALRR